MTATLIAFAIALAAAVGGLIAFGIAAIAATNRAGGFEGAEREIAVRLEVANANTETEKRRADAEKKRGDALDAALADAAVTGPVDGAFDRLLSSWRAARAAGGGDIAAVRDAATAGSEAASADPDRLMRPGE